ncbi:MAG: hypothetical protein LBW85_09800 [Deltaproteobacteria bacterium]|nr:hypothetical protein [Deltaproteobacteria bacterium]
MEELLDPSLTEQVFGRLNKRPLTVADEPEGEITPPAPVQPVPEKYLHPAGTRAPRPGADGFR